MRCLSDQRYNFLKANHNIPCYDTDYDEVVYQIKDTIFWKQITTIFTSNPCASALFIRSKIQFFESKSQLCIAGCIDLFGCLSDQRYNFLKANHNLSSSFKSLAMLFIRSKIQFFESKSQHNCVIIARIQVVYQIKDTIFWKQITTTSTWQILWHSLFIRSKIQFFESKSQLNHLSSVKNNSVVPLLFINH